MCDTTCLADGPVRTENLNPAVMMMKSVQDERQYDAAHVLDGAIGHSRPVDVRAMSAISPLATIEQTFQDGRKVPGAVIPGNEPVASQFD